MVTEVMKLLLMIRGVGEDLLLMFDLIFELYFAGFFVQLEGVKFYLRDATHAIP